MDISDPVLLMLLVSLVCNLLLLFKKSNVSVLSKRLESKQNSLELARSERKKTEHQLSSVKGLLHVEKQTAHRTRVDADKFKQKLKYLEAHYEEYKQHATTETERLRMIVKGLKQLCSVDPLTGAKNRRALKDDFGRVLLMLPSTIPQKRTRKGAISSLGVIMFDLDKFKPINDTYGHAIGDKVLRIIVARIRKQLRKHDAIYRIGGDEFMILLPGIGPDRLYNFVQRMLLIVGKSLIAVNDSVTVSTTASVGYIYMTEMHTHVDYVYKAVDKAMYDAKSAGGNRAFRHDLRNTHLQVVHER